MERILILLTAILLCETSFAKKPYNIKEAKEIAQLNKAPGLIATYKGRRVYFDPDQKQYLTYDSFVYRYGQSVVNKLDSIYIAGIKRDSQKAYLAADSYRSEYKIRIRPRNIISGSAMIGVSAGAYMIGSSIIDSRAKTLEKELSDDKITINEYNNSIESLNNTKRAMGYVCGGISLAGAIVVITGIYKDYANGIDIGHNFTVSDNGAGISLTKKF